MLSISHRKLRLVLTLSSIIICLCFKHAHGQRIPKPTLTPAVALNTQWRVSFGFVSNESGSPAAVLPMDARSDLVMLRNDPSMPTVVMTAAPIPRYHWLEDYGHRDRPGREYVGVLSVHHRAGLMDDFTNQGVALNFRASPITSSHSSRFTVKVNSDGRAGIKQTANRED